MIKMKGEIPVFRRCCFCLPLRYGLLAWGYFKLIADACLVLSIAYMLINILIMIEYFAKEDEAYKIRYSELMEPIIAIALFFTDLIVTILFIVGEHTKNLKLIRVFYFLSMGMWVATFLLGSFTIVTSTQKLLSNVLLLSCVCFVALAVQTYFLLLLRSEIIELRNSGESRFVNNVAEAECTMRCEDVVATEPVKPDN